MSPVAGSPRDDTTVRLGPVWVALVRRPRLVVRSRLHCVDLSVELVLRFSRDVGFLVEAPAGRAAAPGTFDPTYLVDAAGKLMMLKMRRDYKEQQGARYSVRAFHEAVLAQGSAPFWAHRRLLLNETTDTSLE
jgi:hypothetical protein